MYGARLEKGYRAIGLEIEILGIATTPAGARMVLPEFHLERIYAIDERTRIGNAFARRKRRGARLLSRRD